MNKNKILRSKISYLLIFSNIVEISVIIAVTACAFSKNFYFLREFFAVILNIGLFLLPIEFFFWSLLTYRDSKKQKRSLKNSISKTIVIAFCLLTCFSLFLFSSSSTSSFYSPNGVQKYTKKGSYYVVLNNKNVSINKWQYNNILENEPYTFYYYSNNFLKIFKIISIHDDNGNVL